MERTLQMAFLIGDAKRFTDVLGDFSWDFRGTDPDSPLGWETHPAGVTQHAILSQFPKPHGSPGPTNGFGEVISGIQCK